jgi:hypothetical protein
MDLREEKEIEDIERVAYDNDLTDEYILRDFHTLDFRQVTIDEIKFYFSGNRLHWFSSLIKENLLIDTSNNPISEDKLKQYLKEYGKGFREGYFKYLEGYFKYLDKTNEGIYFDTKEIILFKKENKNYINKIYSKVYKPTNLSCLPLESISMENNSKEIYKIIEDDLFNFGVIDGEIYKAWIIISKYNSMFIKKWDNEKFIEEQIENNLITENLNIDSRDTDENKTSQHNKLIWQGTQTESVSISNNLEHNPNLWNKDCFNLFKYLIDNYYKGRKRQLTNIWFYLKEYNPQKYTLIATKNQYKVFIKELGVVITNFDKNSNRYDEKEYKTMMGHRINFEGK